MGNPRSCSFSIGRGPRSTTWGTWRASTPPSWTSAPVGLHWAEHHRNSWVKSPYDLTHRNGWALHHDNPGLVQAQGQDIWWSIWIWWSLPNPPRTTTPPNHQNSHSRGGVFFLPHPVSPPPIHHVNIFSRSLPFPFFSHLSNWAKFTEGITGATWQEPQLGLVQ